MLTIPLPATERSATVAVIGSGAVGLSLGAAFATAGHGVTVCGARAPFEEIRVTRSSGVSSYPVSHVADPASVPSFSTVVVAVKAHHTADIAPWLTRVAASGSAVIVAQNGVEHRQRVQDIVVDALIVPVIVYLNAERSGPGAVTVRHVGAADLAVPSDTAASRVADALTRGGMRVDVENDFLTAAWAKLLTNITANPLTALTGRRAEVMRDPGIASLTRQIMLEAVAVAQADGANLSEAHADRALAWLQNVPEGATTSMREDRLAGRELEFDALTGAVVRASRRHGIPVPTNEMILTLLTAIRTEKSSA